MNNVLVMLQTNSNQAYIYSSPRLREQIGASFQITLLSQWVDEEAKKLLEVAKKSKKRGSLPGSFWGSKSSGKVIVRLTENDGEPKALARNLIGAVTRRAFEEAPGLDVTGVFTPPDDADGTRNGMTDDEAVTQDSLDALDREFNAYSLNRPPAAARFPQLPFLERGAESALPAAHELSPSDLKAIRERARELSTPILNDDEDGVLPTQTSHDAPLPLSLPSRVKRAWSRAARRHQLQDVIAQWPSDRTAPTNIEVLFEDPYQLEKAFQDVPVSDGAAAPNAEADTRGDDRSSSTPCELSSVGVIHIDGNGVGAVMRDLQKAYCKVRDHLPEDDFQKLVEHSSDHNPVSFTFDDFQWFIMEVNHRLDKTVKRAVSRAWADVEKYANPTDRNSSAATASKPHVIPATDSGSLTKSGRKYIRIPIVPVLVGGDDLTVYIAGDYAIPFAEAYIRHYEELTNADEVLRHLAVVVNKRLPDAEPGPLTASAGVAIAGRNFPFHIAYDLAEKLVSRGKKLGKKKGEVQCSTLDFHILRDTTVLDPDDTLTEYKDRTQRPFLIGHYSEERVTGTAHAEPGAADGIAGPSANGGQWKQILRAVAAFNGQDPDQPGVSLTDPFPRTRANRIIKLLAEEYSQPEDRRTPKDCTGYTLKKGGKTAPKSLVDECAPSADGCADKIEPCPHPLCRALREWTNAVENTRSADALQQELRNLPKHDRLTNDSSAQSGGNAAQSIPNLQYLKWLLDLLDLAENLPAGYVQSYSALHETGLGEDAASASDEPEAPRSNDDPRSTPSPDEGASK